MGTKYKGDASLILVWGGSSEFWIKMEETIHLKSDKFGYVEL